MQEGYRGLLLALGRSADKRPRSPQPLRTHAVAASATDYVCARFVAAPQASADPFNLSILVPAARARPLVERVQVTTREDNAKRADHPARSGQLATSLPPAPISKAQIVTKSGPLRSGLRRSRPSIVAIQRRALRDRASSATLRLARELLLEHSRASSLHLIILRSIQLAKNSSIDYNCNCFLFEFEF